MAESQIIQYHYKGSQSKHIDIMLATFIIGIFLLLALFAPLLAGNESYHIIPFAPGDIDPANPYAPPGAESVLANARHLLGTDGLGRDLLSGLLFGSRTALVIGIGAAMTSLVAGLLYGLVFGYYGNDRITVFKNQKFIWLLLIIVLGFLLQWMVYLREGYHSISIPVLISIILVGIAGYFLWMTRKKSKKEGSSGLRMIKMDSWSMRILDLFKALPALFILLILLRLVDAAGIYNLILIIAFLLWPVYARHARAEMLNWRSRDFVYNAVLQGKADYKIIFRELLPFVIRPLIVSSAFIAASALLLEATLSFLGIGIPIDHVSWGTLINDARNNMDAWWLVLFPGICLFLLIWSFQTIGRYIDRRLKAENQWQLD